jgi:glycosyltransferase involved in cell wall biosynthesis
MVLVELSRTIARVTNPVHVLICDNASDPPIPSTLPIGGAASTRIVYESTIGKSYALNRLLNLCTTEWIIFIDDDILLSERFLEAYINGMATYPEADCFGGSISPHFEGLLTPFHKVVLCTFPWVLGTLKVERDRPMSLPNDDLPYGANVAFRRHILARIGFDTDLGMFGKHRVPGEDTKAVISILQNGSSGWLLTSAAAHHVLPPHRTSPLAFWRWYAAKGRAVMCSEESRHYAWQTFIALGKSAMKAAFSAQLFTLALHMLAFMAVVIGTASACIRRPRH